LSRVIRSASTYVSTVVGAFACTTVVAEILNKKLKQGHLVNKNKTQIIIKFFLIFIVVTLMTVTRKISFSIKSSFLTIYLNFYIKSVIF